MREARDTRGTARCIECLFGRAITIVDKPRKTKANPDPADIVREMCECHVARPTRFGFPTVRPDDFCALHVDAVTCERTFAGLAPQSMSII